MSSLPVHQVSEGFSEKGLRTEPMASDTGNVSDLVLYLTWIDVAVAVVGLAILAVVRRTRPGSRTSFRLRLRRPRGLGV
jgi:hypothetical protein